MRHLQQSCSAIDIFHAFLILQMHIHSHGLQLRSSAGSCNRHNKNLFGSAIRQLLLLSKYPQIYPKPYPRRTCKSIFQSECTSQQKVDTTLYFYTSFNEHNTPYTVLESDNSESMPDVLH